MGFANLSPAEVERSHLRQASELAAESGEGWAGPAA
jgi:hypothetical protein